MVKTNEIPDNVLLDLITSGHRHAYTILYDRYYHSLRRKACSILKDEMEAEDLVQSFFIDVWQKKLYQQIHSSVEAYMHTAIYHKCLNLVEKKKRMQIKFLEYMRSLQNKIECNTVEDHEFIDKLRLVISELPIRRLQVFTLVYLEEKKYKDVAVEMGISVNTVKTHLKKAMKLLQQQLMITKICLII